MLADRHNDKRLNSPNDLVYGSDGTLFFTDPPFGLPKFAPDPRREQPHSGVYSVKDGNVRLGSTDFTGPNYRVRLDVSGAGAPRKSAEVTKK
ncbi:MAG: hypothetical protein HY301_06975 [Verrucomicrobia bacterium]|nr:hypothetical protein [Verrucomicrobiota bacterium]